MAAVLESNTQSEEELVEALRVNGYERVTEKGDAEEAKPVVEEEKPSEEPGEPGEKIPAETDTEVPSDTETDDSSQEKPQEPKSGEEKKKSKGGYQSKVEKQTKVIEQLEVQLEAKSGNEARLLRELEEARTKLSELQPAEPEKPAELVRPKRPQTLKELDFDEEKHEAAQIEYEKQLDAYNEAVAEKKATEKIEAFKEEQRKQARDNQVAQAEKAFEDRRDKGKADLPDYDDLMAELPDDAINLTGVVGDYIANEAENPAILIHFLMKDVLENDGKEAERIMKLNDLQKLKAIVKIEERLLSESKGTKEPAKAAAETEPKKPAETKPPATEKPKRETPEAPITPVSGGSRTAKSKDWNAQLQAASDAGDSKEYQKIRALMAQEKQPAKV